MKRTFITAALIAASLLPLAADGHEPYRVSEEMKNEFRRKIERYEMDINIPTYIYNVESILDDNAERLKIFMYDRAAADTLLYDPRKDISRLKGVSGICTQCYEMEYAAQRAYAAAIRMDFTFPSGLLANTSSDSIYALIDLLFTPRFDTLADGGGGNLRVCSSLDFYYERRRTGHEMFGDRYDTDRQVLQYITGTYDDIFRIWKMYFFPDADKEATYANRRATTPGYPPGMGYGAEIEYMGRRHRVVLNDSGSSNRWMIRFFLKTE